MKAVYIRIMMSISVLIPTLGLVLGLFVVTGCVSLQGAGGTTTGTAGRDIQASEYAGFNLAVLPESKAGNGQTHVIGRQSALQFVLTFTGTLPREVSAGDLSVRFCGLTYSFTKKIASGTYRTERIQFDFLEKHKQIGPDLVSVWLNVDDKAILIGKQKNILIDTRPPAEPRDIRIEKCLDSDSALIRWRSGQGSDTNDDIVFQVETMDPYGMWKPYGGTVKYARARVAFTNAMAVRIAAVDQAHNRSESEAREVDSLAKQYFNEMERTSSHFVRKGRYSDAMDLIDGGGQCSYISRLTEYRRLKASVTRLITKCEQAAEEGYVCLPKFNTAIRLHPENPAVISFNDAQNECRRHSGRLPTVSELTYAVKAGIIEEFNSGQGEFCRQKKSSTGFTQKGRLMFLDGRMNFFPFITSNGEEEMVDMSYRCVRPLDDF